MRVLEQPARSLGGFLEDRTSLLTRLVRYELPLGDTVALLRSFGWNSEEVLVVLTVGDVVQLLTRYVAGELSAKQVEHWAELLEMRSDLGYETDSAVKLRAVVSGLANPEEHEVITPRLAIRICRSLTEAAS